MNLDNRLLIFRKSLKLKQQELATSIGVDRTALSKYENYGSIPDTIIIILELKYGLNREWLLEGKGEMITPKEYVQYDEQVVMEGKEIYSPMQDNVTELIKMNKDLVQQVSDLIKMQMINAQTINNLSSFEHQESKQNKKTPS